MATYGHVIKFERIKHKIKQVQLAKDICTPSYLSKIENNSIVPSEEVREKLFKRLGIKPSPSSMSEEDYLKYVHSIYFEAVMYKDRQKTELILKDLDSKYFLFIDSTNFYTYQLIMLRLNLIVFDIQNETKKIMKPISEMSKDFNDYQNFLFRVNLGFFYFMKQDYPHSLEFLENAIEYTHRVKSERWAIADLEYAIGLVYLYLDRNLSSIEFSKNAVLYFEKDFYYKRAIESYIVLGIVYRRAERYKKAAETLQLAKKISIELNIIENYPHIFYCLGIISAEQGEMELAIENFKEALSLRSDNLGKITCIYAIMLTYAQKKDKNSVVLWCEKGIKFCMNERESTIEHYIHHFQCYLARFSNSENLEASLMKAILYFKKKKDYPYAHKNSILLAQFYLDNKKYKKSASYFSLANEYLAKKEKRKFMEDI